MAVKRKTVEEQSAEIEPPNPTLKGLTSGRIVYVVGEDKQIRPAIITRLHTAEGCVNLHVFLDHSPWDANEKSVLHSVNYSESKKPGTWHWIEREF